MWELAGSVARVLQNHAANIIFLCGSWLGHWGARLKWCCEHNFLVYGGRGHWGAHLKMMLRTSISHVGAGWLWGARLKMMLRTSFSHVRALGSVQKPRFWRPPSAHHCLIDRTLNFAIFCSTSGSGHFQLPVTLFSYAARRTLKNYATNINFSCGSWPAPWRACLKIVLRTSFAYVGAGWAIGART